MELHKLESELIELGFKHIKENKMVFFSNDGFAILKHKQSGEMSVVSISGVWSAKKITQSVGPPFLLPCSESVCAEQMKKAVSFLFNKKTDWRIKILLISDRARRIYKRKLRHKFGFWNWCKDIDIKNCGCVSTHTTKNTPLKYIT